MFNKEYFDEVVEATGFKRKYLAEQLDMTANTFSKKASGLLDWKISEVCGLMALLCLSKSEVFDIFFS